MRVTAVSNSLRDVDLRRARREASRSPSFRTSSIARCIGDGRGRTCGSVSPVATRRRRSSCTSRTSARSSASTRWWRSSIASARRCRRGCCSSATVPSWRRRSRRRASSASARIVDAVGAQEEVVPLLSIARSLPAAVGAGELRPCGARGDGVRGAGRRVARGRAARGHRARRERLPASARGDRRDGGERRRAAHQSRCCTHSVAQAACRRVRSEFCVERVVPMYEACYRELLVVGPVHGPQSTARHGRNFATQIKTASLRLAP